jgi:hypothetical protein
MFSRLKDSVKRLFLRQPSRPEPPRPPTNSVSNATPEAALTICVRVVEVQALLDDHLASRKHTATEVVAKAQAVLSESALPRAMFEVGYYRTRRRKQW